VKILFLIPRLDYHGAARQLTLLAAGLPRPAFEPVVCVLGEAGPLTAPLDKAGVRVVTLGWGRRPAGWLDPRRLIRLGRLLDSMRPQIVHVWQVEPLRVLRLLPSGWRKPVVLSAAWGAPCPGAIDRWLLRRVDRFAVQGETEANRSRQLGVEESKLVVVPPAVSSPPADVSATLASLPAGARFIACMGTFERHKGFGDAVWAFDILRMLYADLHLVLIGTGPDHDRLLQFARNIHCVKSVHMPGERADSPALLARAEVVWVPDRVDGSLSVALEAMAVSRPVVASRLPGLAEVVLDGQTGILVPPGQPVELARHTRPLLESAELRRRLGEAGRQRAVEHFPVSELVRRCMMMYQELEQR
jgi:glycosyltransferase involved in cell wall biosynthesis